MFFDAGLKIGNYIYLFERISRCLISIYIPSGEIKIEAYLPWRYTENKISMLPWGHSIVIYSVFADHFLVYDCLSGQIITVKLQGIETDKTGVYFSNILANQDGFIVLPFKGMEIKIYEKNGKTNFIDSQWLFDVVGECHCDAKLFGNIRVDSACITENQIFFSFVYRNQNYLCKYELNQDKHLCKIVYYSKDIAIRGVYAYPNMVLFRRVFPYKTEIVMITLDSNTQKTIVIDRPSMFEEDIYGNSGHLKVALKNEIVLINESELKKYKEIYNFEQSDVYIAKGILFNATKNEIILPDVNYTNKYSIEKTIRKIKNSSSYQKGYKKIFIDEGRYAYKLYDLIGCIAEPLPIMMDDKGILKDKSIGKLIWRTML